MQIGIIGAGQVGLALGGSMIGAGHHVKLSSARPRRPDTRRQGIAPRRSRSPEAGAQELVLLRCPGPQCPTCSTRYRIGRANLVDATNPFVTFIRCSSLICRAERQRHRRRTCPGARVVKAFNSITMVNFEKGPQQGEARRVLFVSGDDVASKQTVQDLITELGYAAIDLGSLDVGGRMQAAWWPTGRPGPSGHQ